MQSNLLDAPAFDAMREFYGGTLNQQDKKEIVGNLCGFFDLLQEWRKQQVIQPNETEVLSDGQTGKEQKKAASGKATGSNEIRCLNYTRIEQQRKA
jgi:hypothetical protein